MANSNGQHSSGPSRKRYSLRALILAMTAVCLLLGTWSIYVDPYRKQAQSLALVNRLKGEAQIVPAKGPGWQRWLVETMLGDETFIQVTGANLADRKVDDSALAGLTGLRYLTTLNLDRTQITDAGGSVLRSFPRLRILSLRFTKAGAGTAEQLAKLAALEHLSLTSTQVSDEAIPALSQLTGLEELFIRWTQLTNEGAEQLQQALPNCAVYYHALTRDVAAKPQPAI